MKYKAYMANDDKILAFYCGEKHNCINKTMLKIYEINGHGDRENGGKGSLWKCAEDIYNTIASGTAYAYADYKFWIEEQDVTELNEREMLEELANRVVKYDELRDKRKAMLEETIDQKGEWSPDALTDYDNLCMEVDEAFCRVREIIRIVKKDPKFWAC